MTSVIENAQASSSWTSGLRDGALHLFRLHLARVERDKPSECVGPDEMLWVEEIFFCRAAQEGLGNSLKSESALTRIETFLSGRKLDDCLEYLEWVEDCLVPQIQSLAVSSASLAGAQARAPVIQAELEISRHLAIIAGRLRSVVAQGRRQTYPTEPLILAEFLPCPLSNLSRDQLAIRSEWAGENGVGDCWGRAHGGTLNDFARYSQTVGGKIDRSLELPTDKDSAQNLQSKRLQMALMTASEVAEELILASPTMCRRTAGGTASGDAQPWSDKSRQQFRSAARLFTKFMGAVPFVQATHRDFVEFYKELLTLPGDHHTRLADDGLSLREIAERASTSVDGKKTQYLKPTTARRHLRNLRMLRAWLGTAFILPSVFWQDLISWRGEGRLVPNRLTAIEVEEIFHLPIWTGAVSYRGTPREGTEVWHSAFYWVPLLQWYSGIARDVLCALELVDLVKVAELHCLRVRGGVGGVTEDRGFDREVPLHPEIIRLGFLDYVQALGMEGEALLFPELRRASGQIAGDVFSSRCWRPIRTALPWLNEDCGVGAIRLTAERVLKDLRVPEDMSRDLFGIRGNSQIDLVYSKVTPPAYLALIVAKITNVTSHIEARPIRLLPAQARTPTAARIVPRMQERLHQENSLKGMGTAREAYQVGKLH